MKNHDKNLITATQLASLLKVAPSQVTKLVKQNYLIKESRYSLEDDRIKEIIQAYKNGNGRKDLCPLNSPKKNRKQIKKIKRRQPTKPKVQVVVIDSPEPNSKLNLQDRQDITNKILSLDSDDQLDAFKQDIQNNMILSDNVVMQQRYAQTLKIIEEAEQKKRKNLTERKIFVQSDVCTAFFSRFVNGVSNSMLELGESISRKILDEIRLSEKRKDPYTEAQNMVKELKSAETEDEKDHIITNFAKAVSPTPTDRELELHIKSILNQEVSKRLISQKRAMEKDPIFSEEVKNECF